MVTGEFAVVVNGVRYYDNISIKVDASSIWLGDKQVPGIVHWVIRYFDSVIFDEPGTLDREHVGALHLLHVRPLPPPELIAVYKATHEDADADDTDDTDNGQLGDW